MHEWLLVSTTYIFSTDMFLYLDYNSIFITFLSHGAVMCVCACNYIKFYECFLSLEAVCVCLYACRCVGCVGRVG